MKLELIQPFINAADAVLAETLQTPTSIGDLTMEEEAYRRKGVASLVTIKGDIEGRIIFDMDAQTAAKVASHLAGTPMPARTWSMRLFLSTAVRDFRLAGTMPLR